MGKPDLGPGIEAEMTCGAAPVQIEGTIDGHPFYFRSRWYRWTFALGKPGEDVGGITDPDGMVYFRESDETCRDHTWASMLPHNEAWQIVQECAGHARLALAH